MRTVKAPPALATLAVPAIAGPAPVIAAADIGNMLTLRRCQLGWSQEHVAARSGLRQSRVSFLERNPARATVAELLSLCAALGLELGAKKTAVPAVG